MISQFGSPTVPMDSPLYAQPEIFKRETYSPGDFGPPADGIEYRVTYDPKSGEYLQRGTGKLIPSLRGVGQPPAPMLSGLLDQVKEFYWPSRGFTWKTAALWAGTVLLVRKVL